MDIKLDYDAIESLAKCWLFTDNIIERFHIVPILEQPMIFDNDELKWFIYTSYTVFNIIVPIR